jgi:hypothetical protein
MFFLSVYQAIGPLVIGKSRDKLLDFERENQRMCRAATPQFARTTTFGKSHNDSKMEEEGRKWARHRYG